jgi:hypothetical protein
MAAKKGFFFYWQKEEAKNELYLLSACYSSRAVGGGGVGWGARGMAVRVQVQNVGISVEWLFLFLIGAVFGTTVGFNPLTPNDLQRRREVSHLKIKIPSKNICEKPTNTSIIHSD